MRRDRSDRLSGIWEHPQEARYIALITDDSHRVSAPNTSTWATAYIEAMIRGHARGTVGRVAPAGPHSMADQHRDRRGARLGGAEPSTVTYSCPVVSDRMR